jgi:hypothetical protein
MSEARIAAAVGEEHCDFGEAARLPVQLSPVAEIRIRRAAPHAAEPPEPPRRTGEWYTVRQTPRRKRQFGNCVG